MTLAWKTQCSPTEKLVLISLADQANDAGLCWPSVSSIENRTGLSDRAIQKAISSLQENGHLTVHFRAGKSSYYTVNPRTTFTPELNSPPNHVHPTPEPRSEDPRTTFTHNHKEPSVNPKKTRAKTSLSLFDWLAKCKEKNERPIPTDHAVYVYADKIGLPDEFVKITWVEFRNYFLENPDKKQKDWRMHFSNFIRANYLKIWYTDESGQFKLTSRGLQAKKAMETA